jgi:small multidrug resistance pump
VSPPHPDASAPATADGSRRRFAWAYLLIAIVSGASGTSALSRTQGFTLLQPSLVTAACYAVCFLALTRALRVIPVSIAYAVWSGIGIALVSVIAWGLFDQPLNAGELLGIGLILAGTVVIQLYSRAARSS